MNLLKVCSGKLVQDMGLKLITINSCNIDLYVNTLFSDNKDEVFDVVSYDNYIIDVYISTKNDNIDVINLKYMLDRKLRFKRFSSIRNFNSIIEKSGVGDIILKYIELKCNYLIDLAIFNAISEYKESKIIAEIADKIVKLK